MTLSTLTTLLVVIIWCTLGLAVLHWTNRAPIQYLRGIDTAPPPVQAIAQHQPVLFAMVLSLQTLCFLAIWPLFLVRKLSGIDYPRGWRRLIGHPRKP
ncbi:hypothetical protein OG582_40585 (plasmid) [Streptomyces anulatus]|uniref:hypothetical protein n=1 Tax=Streptomyces anulatus TaxID=1892 RepID=UPI0032565FB9